MHERIPHPQPSEAAFDVAIATGMRLAAELVHTAGPAGAIGAIGDTLHAKLSDDEMGILRAAVTLIVAQREVAPDDPSTMPAPAAASCPDSSCRICTIGGQADALDA